MKTTNKLGYKVLIFNFVSLAIAGGLIGSGIALGINDAIGYGVAVMLMPLLTLRIKAGVSVKRNFVGIALFALGVAVFGLFHYLSFTQFAIPESLGYVWWLILICPIFCIVGLWVALGGGWADIFTPIFNKEDYKCCKGHCSCHHCEDYDLVNGFMNSHLSSNIYHTSTDNN